MDHGSPPQNWLRESLMKLSWVRLSFSPPCRPCCSLEGERPMGGRGNALPLSSVLSGCTWVHPGSVCEEQEMQGRKTQQFFLSHQCVLGVVTEENLSGFSHGAGWSIDGCLAWGRTSHLFESIDYYDQWWHLDAFHSHS